MPFYTNMASMANRMLVKFGQTVWLFKDEPMPYDRDGAQETVITKKYRGRGAIFTISSEAKAGTLIEAGDMQLIMSAFDYKGNALRKPEENDRIRDEGLNIYMLKKDARPIAPGGIVVAYDCIISGA